MPSILHRFHAAGVLALAPFAACASQDAGSHAGPASLSDAGLRQEQLRGSITPEREWWDVQHYELRLQVDPAAKSIKGSNVIRFTALAAGERMQIDLQPPLKVTRATSAGQELAFEREGNVYWLSLETPLPQGAKGQIEVFYEGLPLESENPPWSGGFSWDEDELGNPFIATTCQGLGASVWWPNKDHGYDEPDQGMDIHVTVPEELTAVSNGRLQSTTKDAAAKTRTFHWKVANPINNYGVNVNIGKYVVLPGVYQGAFGKLDTEYWVLEHQVEQAREHFKEVPRTLAAFEHWFGKYPFYEDSFKLVVVPYLGMEHQSSVTYGNGFANGYRGRDLSKTGVGLKFDFIIVHESAHEWFGNSISMRDTADMWIHESFANYAECLFVEYHFTEQESQDYVIGCRQLIGNKDTIIGEYGLNRSGSSDMYYKGGNMLHTMRHMLGDDVRWRQVLLDLGRVFWHKTVSTEEFEARMSRSAGFDYSLVFDQYLRTTDIPQLQYSIDGLALHLWWDRVVPGFSVPVVLRLNGDARRLRIGDVPTTVQLAQPLETIELDRNFYMTVAEQASPAKDR